MYANGMHDACHFVSEKVESLFTSYNNDTYPFLNVVYLCSKVLALFFINRYSRTTDEKLLVINYRGVTV